MMALRCVEMRRQDTRLVGIDAGGQVVGPSVGPFEAFWGTTGGMRVFRLVAMAEEPDLGCCVFH